MFKPSQESRDKAFEVIVFGVIIILALAILAAMILGPITGNWAPDIGAGICLGIAGVWYGLAKFFDWKGF